MNIAFHDIRHKLGRFVATSAVAGKVATGNFAEVRLHEAIVIAVQRPQHARPGLLHHEQPAVRAGDGLTVLRDDVRQRLVVQHLGVGGDGLLQHRHDFLDQLPFRVGTASAGGLRGRLAPFPRWPATWLLLCHRHLLVIPTVVLWDLCRLLGPLTTHKVGWPV